jgi:hypothetical protein
LFDCAFYAASVGLPADLGLCVEHYLRSGAAEGYSPHRLFDPQAYVRANPDLGRSTVDPYFHFLSRGVREGRGASVPREALSHLGAMSIERLTGQRLGEQARVRGWISDRPSEWAGQTGIVSASSLGSPSCAFLADRIAKALRADGVTVFRLDQNSERPVDPAFDFVVAPHEFFEMGAGTLRKADINAGRSILLNTGRPGTASYFTALKHSQTAAVLLDVLPHASVLQLESGRIQGGYLPVLDAPAADASANDLRKRPIDVLFAGTLTARRRESLAYLAPALAKYRCSIHAPTNHGLDPCDPAGRSAFRHIAGLARRATVVLHLHADSVPCPNWTWIGHALAHGAVVVSETCLPYPGVDAEPNMVAADLDGLPAVLDRVLSSADRRAGSELVTRAPGAPSPQFDLGAELRALAYLFNGGFADRA